MARYGTDKYGNFYYGDSPQIELSIQPFTATALDYNQVRVEWTAPRGDFVRFRLVRNQDGTPDTQEDGVILLDLSSLEDINNSGIYLDGATTNPVEVPLFSGKYAHYTIWLLLTTNDWYSAGEVSVLLASPHSEQLEGTDRTRNTHEKFMDILPRVFTSSTQSPLDVVDTESDLYNFLYGFTYTLDELLTFIDLLLPNHLYTNFSPDLLDAKAYEFGFKSENRASTRYQRRLVREATYLSTHKGTLDAIGTLIESMTGYIPNISRNSNLMLSTQDSTFLGGTGSWVSIGPVALSTTQVIVPPSGETYAIDDSFVGVAVVELAGSKIVLGTADPILYGIPVSGGTSYTFSGYLKATAAGGTTATKIYWYDYQGDVISSSSGTDSLSTSWSKKSLTATSPTTAVYAGLEITFTAAKTYHLDMLQFSESSVTNFHEARSVEIQVTPTKHNYITNPSFENATLATTGWTTVGGSSATKDTVGPSPAFTVYGPPGLDTGNSYLNVKGATSSGVYTNVTSAEVISSKTAGSFYTFSMYARATTAIITAASGNGTTVTYTANNSFIVGQTISITNLTTSSGDSLNLKNVVIASVSSTNFTVTNTTVGTASGTQAGYVEYLSSATVTAASGNGTTVTYTAVNNFVVGQEVSITGLRVGTGSSLNLSNVLVASATSSNFTVTNSTVGVADTGQDGVATYNVKSQITVIADPVTGDNFSNTKEVTLTHDWARFEVNIFIPGNTPLTSIQCRVNTQDRAVPREIPYSIDYESAMFELGFRATDYFDGDYLIQGAEWTGTASESESYLYQNKEAKLTRLQQELPRQLPLGTPYTVESMDGIEQVTGSYFKGFA